MSEYTIWNLLTPQLQIKDKHNAEKIKAVMQPFFLNDNIIQSIKEALCRRMKLGLSNCEENDALPMTVTFQTERFHGSEEGDYVGICVHDNLLILTLVKLKQNSPPQITKAYYEVDASTFKHSFKKIYKTFADCIKKFFVDNELDGQNIAAGFCTDLFMVQYSIDTAVIPFFAHHSSHNPCQTDVKALFEDVLSKDDYQGDLYLKLQSERDSKETEKGFYDTDRIYHATFDATLYGMEHVDSKFNCTMCHRILKKFQELEAIKEFDQAVKLDVSHSGIKVEDKVFGNVLFEHPLHKITYVTQDLNSPYVFGYLFGDDWKGHHYFGFKTQKYSTEIVLLLKEIFGVELLRKKKETLDMKASQVILTLHDFLNLIHELKVKLKKMPLILEEKMKLVENINWWYEGCTRTIKPSREELKKLTPNVRLQDIYNKAIYLKQLEIQRAEEEKIRLAKLAGKRIRRKKVEEEEQEIVTAEKRMPQDWRQSKVSEILSEYVKHLEHFLEVKSEEDQLIEKSLQSLNVDDVEENALIIKDLLDCAVNEHYNEADASKREITALKAAEFKEKLKIGTKATNVFTGKEQFLQAAKKRIKGSIFEDIGFEIPRLKRTSNSEILRKVLLCKDYFLTALKMRKEEVEEINFYINELLYRPKTVELEDSKALRTCRKLFIKAAKLRLKEIQDIEQKLDTLTELENNVLYMIPNLYNVICEMYQNTLDERTLSVEKLRELILLIPEEISDKVTTLDAFEDILLKCKKMNESERINLNEQISRLKKEETVVDSEVSEMCHELYSKIFKFRKKELDTLMIDMDTLVNAETGAQNGEDISLIKKCKNVFLTAAVMREKEMESLEKKISEVRSTEEKTVGTKDQHIVVTLKDIFHACIELEKEICEKALCLEDEKFKSCFRTSQVVPVQFTFHELYDVVAQTLKEQTKIDCGQHIKECAEIQSSLKEYLIMAFDVKQKEIEIPQSVLKKDLEIIFTELIEEVKMRRKEKHLEMQRHNQALKISKAWKEVFLIAIKARKEEILKAITKKKKELLEERAILETLQTKESQSADNEARKVIICWKKIFSIAVDLKKKEVENLSQLLKLSKDGDQDSMLDNQEKNVVINSSPDTVPLCEESNSEENIKGNLISETSKMISMCEQIFNLAIQKNSDQLEEMEHEMKPIFVPEYDEEKPDLSESEVLNAFNASKQLLLDLNDNMRLHSLALKTHFETLTQIQENIKSQVSTAKESSKHYLTLLLEIEEKDNEIVESTANSIENAFKELKLKDEQDISPFTDLFVDVLSEELKDSDVKKQGRKKENDIDETAVLEEKPENLTRDEIHSLLLEIEEEHKTGVDAEEVERKRALDICEHCKMVLSKIVELRKNNILAISEELEKLRAPDPKKMKAKAKTAKALERIISCKSMFESCIVSKQKDVRQIFQEAEKMTLIELDKKDSVEFEPAEIAASCRKLFLSATDSRKKNLDLMKLQIDVLSKKKEVLESNVHIKSEEATSIKHDILNTCKELVLGSVDIKMKEIDDIVSFSSLVDEMDLKTEIHLKQVNPEKQKALYTKLEKVKDVIATSKKLCSSAVEKAKKGVKAADEELQILKRALESSEASIVVSTCKQVLNSAVERRELEIQDLESNSQLVKTTAENLVLELQSKLSQEQKADGYIKETSTNVAIENDTLKSVSGESSEVKDKSSHGSLEPETVVTIMRPDDQVSSFFNTCKEILNSLILKGKEEMESILSDIEKLKVTLQKVENEDSQVFEISRNAFVQPVEMRIDEMKAMENELKSLSSIFIDENIKNIHLAKVEKKSEEESEVELAVKSVNRLLHLAAKNRRNEKDAIDFELMKLIRFQDSRISTSCKQFLLAASETTNVETEDIKRKIQLLERTASMSESEVLDMTKDFLMKCIRTAKQQIDQIEYAVKVITKSKMKIEIEDSQYIDSCKKNFFNQMEFRRKEITIFLQEIDALSEIGFSEDYLLEEIGEATQVCVKIFNNGIDFRREEVVSLHCKLIKLSNMKVSEVFSSCKECYTDAAELRKTELKILEEELKNIKEFAKDKDKFLTALRKCEDFFSSATVKKQRESEKYKDELRFLGGKKKKLSKHVSFDFSSFFGSESQENLKTEASEVLGICKEMLYTILDVMEVEIRDMTLAKQQLKRRETNVSDKSPKQIYDPSELKAKFTAKEIALLEAFEEEMFQSENSKNARVLQHCEDQYVKYIEARKESIPLAKNDLQHLSIIEEDAISEASKVIFFLKKMLEETLQKVTYEIAELESNRVEIFKIKEQNNITAPEIIKKYEEIVTSSLENKKDASSHIILSLQFLKTSEEKLKNKVLEVIAFCQKLLLKIMNDLGRDVSHYEKELENLKEFGFSDLEEDDAKLSEDEKAVKASKMILNVAIGRRKKLLRSIDLELKFLKGRTENFKSQVTTLFPNWCERFLRFINATKEDMKMLTKTSEHSVDVANKSGSKIKTNNSAELSSNNDQGIFHKVGLYKDLLKSLEEEKRNQPLYCTSSWNHVLLRSFLINELELAEVKYNKQRKTHSIGKNSNSVDITIQYTWEELLQKSVALMEREKTAAEKAKNTKQSFLHLLPWNKVLSTAIENWSEEMKALHIYLKNKNLLIQWKESMKSQEYLENLRSHQHGMLSSNIDADTDFSEFYSKELSDFQELLTTDVNTEASNEVSEEYVSQSQATFSWNNLLLNAVELMDNGSKMLCLLREKPITVQSEASKYNSSWDDLFLKAIELRKNDLKNEVKEDNLLKQLAKSLTQKMHGDMKEIAKTSEQQKHFVSESWTLPISQQFQALCNELGTAISIKSAEMDRATYLNLEDHEKKLEDSDFLNTEHPEILLHQGKKLFSKALEILNDEIMLKEQKILSQSNTQNMTEIVHDEMPCSINLWFQIVSATLSYKQSGLKLESKFKKWINKSYDDLLEAAYKRKIKEMENNHDSQSFVGNKKLMSLVSPEFHSWHDISHGALNIIVKDVAKMQKMGMKTVETFETATEQNENIEYSTDNSKEIDEKIPWTDLALAALDKKGYEVEDAKLQNDVEHEFTQMLPSWTELLFIMSLLDKANSESMDSESVYNSNMLLNVRALAKSNIISLDEIFLAMIEEALSELNELEDPEATYYENKGNTLLAVAEKKLKLMKKDISRFDSNGKLLQGFELKSWSDLLPNEMGLNRILMEETLSKSSQATFKLESPKTTSELPDIVIWRHIFPLAVEIWRKDVENYLMLENTGNIQSSQEKSFLKTTNLNTLMKKIGREKSRLVANKKEIAALSYAAISERLNVEDDETILTNRKVPALMNESDLLVTSDAATLGRDEKFHSETLPARNSFEHKDPEYFNVCASWQDLVLAALQKNKTTLCDLLQAEGKTDSKSSSDLSSDSSAETKSEASKFTAANVLSLNITFPELLEVVADLKRKGRVICKEILEKDKPAIVISKFVSIFANAMQKRKEEATICERMLSDLEQNISNAGAQISATIFYFIELLNKALKIRVEETESIDNEMKSLGDFIDLYAEYVDSSIAESLWQRNMKCIHFLNKELPVLQELHENIELKMKSHLDASISTFQIAVKKMCSVICKSEIPSLDANSDNLDFEDKAIVYSATEVLLEISCLRQEESEFLAVELPKWKRMNRDGLNVEESCASFLKVAENMFSNILSKRKDLMDKLILQRDSMINEKEELCSGITDAFKSCKILMIESNEYRKGEIEDLIDALNMVAEATNKDFRAFTALENFVSAAVEKRHGEIMMFEEHSIYFSDTEFPEILSLCVECLESSIDRCMKEIIAVENLVQSLRTDDENTENELSKVLYEALADNLGHTLKQSTTPSLHSVKKSSEQKKLKDHLTSMCSEIYENLTDMIEKEVSFMEDNLRKLKSYRGHKDLKLIKTFDTYNIIINNEIQNMQKEMEVSSSELKVMMEQEEKVSCDITANISTVKEKLEVYLSEVMCDIESLKTQLQMLSNKTAVSEDGYHFELSTAEAVIAPSDPVKAKKKSMKKEKTVTETAEEPDPNNINGYKLALKILNSALGTREDDIAAFLKKIKSCSDTELYCIEAVVSCLETFASLEKKREKEIECIEVFFETAQKFAETEVLQTCMKQLKSLYQFDIDFLESIKPDFDRLVDAEELLEKKKQAIFSVCEKGLSSAIEAGEAEKSEIEADLEYLECMSTTASTENVAANMKIFHSTLEFRKSEILSLKFDLEKLPFEIEILPVVSNCIVILNSCLNRRQYETALISKELESAENKVAQYGQDYSTRLSKIVKENEIVIQWLSPLINKLKEIEEELKSEAMKILEACQKCYFDVLETFKIEKEAISIDIEMLQKVETYEKGIIDTEGKEIVVTLKDIFLAAFSLKKEELERFIRKKDIEDTVKMKASEILKEIQEEPRKRESISERKSLQRLRSTASIKSKESLTTASVKEEMQFGNFISYFNKIKADRKAKMEYLIMKDFEEIEGSLVKTASLEDFLDTHSIASEEFEEEPAKEPEKFVNKVYEVKVKQIEEEIANKRQKIKEVIKSRKSYMEDIICRKRKEMEGRIVSEGMKMNVTVNLIKEQGLHVVCTLKDLFSEILNKREQEREDFTPKEESTLIETHEEKRITVMLEKFMDVILVIKEEDIAMMKHSKKKDVEKSISNMKLELDDIIQVSEEKLEDVLSEYARKEKSKAMEFAVSGTVSVKDDSAICDEEIFPDVNRFQMFVKSLKCSLERSEKKKIAVYTDTSFRTEEIIKNNPARIPLLGSLPSKSEVPNKLLELFDVEVSHLKKVLKDIELNKAEAIQRGISFKTTETDESSAAFQHAQKEITMNIASVVNTNSCLLMFGSYIDPKCDIALNFVNDSSLMYFENIENVEKWSPPQKGIKEVIIDVNLKEFSNDATLDSIITKFDMNVSGNPTLSSRLECLISDYGLLEQLKVTCLELHHNHLLCRRCNFAYSDDKLALSFEDISHLLSAKVSADAIKAIPIQSGVPSEDDVSIACYICKVILLRAAILTSVCISCSLERLNRDNIMIITNSILIKESSEYQQYLKTFVSAFVPQKTIEFIFCSSSNCGIGAAFSAATSLYFNKRNPRAYLLQLQNNLKEGKKYFSVQQFLDLLKIPDIFNEAIILAQDYKEKMNFDAPLSVVWVFYVMNDDFTSAEELFQKYPVSLKKVHILVCRQILSSENISFGKRYLYFINKYEVEPCIKESAYRTLLDLLFYKSMYTDAAKLVQECLGNNIPLKKLNQRTLQMLQEFLAKEAMENGTEQSFTFAIEDIQRSSSDSDDGENFEK